jgi:predicted O-linked N-acetylglucosamine transferase (SPINDLY family)
MDYLIADELLIPDALEQHYSEKIIRLPVPYLPGGRAAPAASPSRMAAHLPAKATVFCSFNAPYKLTPPLFTAWMQILSRVSGSVLWIGNVPPPAGDRLRQYAEQHGVSAERLVFAARTATLEDHLARLALADVFLDTFPYNAHSSARDALAAGVPLITLRGESFASRVATSLLFAVGLGQLSVATVQDYVETAVNLVGADGELAAVKSRLAAHVPDALCRPQRYCRQLESAFLQIWARHRDGLDAASVRVAAR